MTAKKRSHKKKATAPKVEPKVEAPVEATAPPEEPTANLQPALPPAPRRKAGPRIIEYPKTLYKGGKAPKSEEATPEGSSRVVGSPAEEKAAAKDGFKEAK